MIIILTHFNIRSSLLPHGQCWICYTTASACYDSSTLRSVHRRTRHIKVPSHSTQPTRLFVKHTSCAFRAHLGLSSHSICPGAEPVPLYSIPTMSLLQSTPPMETRSFRHRGTKRSVSGMPTRAHRSMCSRTKTQSAAWPFLLMERRSCLV